jgi:hypothetical protein
MCRFSDFVCTEHQNHEEPYTFMILHDGKVAVRYHQPIPKYIKIGKKEYVCDVKHSVSMLLVDEEEVPALLNFLGGCCGGKKKVFSLPSEEAYNIWLTGHR